MIDHDIWEILAIPPTSDKKLIKQAYARQLKKYHPEDHPEEFKRLQSAYQQALSHHKASDYLTDIPHIKHPTKKLTHELELEQQSLQDDEMIKDYSLDLELNINEEDKPVSKPTPLDLDSSLELDDTLSIDQDDYQRYLLQRIDNQLTKDASINVITTIFEDDQVLLALDDKDFKKRLVKILLAHQKNYDDAVLEYLIRLAQEYHLTSLNNQMRQCKRKRAKFNPTNIIITISVIIVITVINGQNKQEEVTKPNNDHQDVIENFEYVDQNKNHLDDLKEKVYNYNLTANEPYLNGLVIKKGNDKYSFYNENNEKVLDQDIDNVHFTLSKMLIVTIDDHDYLFDCQTRLLDAQAFNKIVAIDVSYPKQEQPIKKLMMSLDGNSWYLGDLSGQKEMDIPKETEIPDSMYEAKIDENGKITIK